MVCVCRVRVVFDEEEWRVGFVQVKGEDGDEDAWFNGAGGEEDAAGAVWVALLLLGLSFAVCFVCGCVCYDWCRSRNRRAEYQPIASAA